MFYGEVDPKWVEEDFIVIWFDWLLRGVSQVLISGDYDTMGLEHLSNYSKNSTNQSIFKTSPRRVHST